MLKVAGAGIDSRLSCVKANDGHAVSQLLTSPTPQRFRIQVPSALSARSAAHRPAQPSRKSPGPRLVARVSAAMETSTAASTQQTNQDRRAPAPDALNRTQVVLITGASRGLGLEMVRQLLTAQGSRQQQQPGEASSAGGLAASLLLRGKGGRVQATEASNAGGASNQQGSSTATGLLVIATARNPDKASDLQALAAQHPFRGGQPQQGHASQPGEGAQSPQLLVVQMDTNSADSIKAAVDKVSAEVGHVDVLINNAGINDPVLARWEDTRAEDAAEVLTTNIVGPLAVSSALMPLLRKGQGRTIVHMSSTLGSLQRVAEGVRGVVKAATGSASAAPPSGASGLGSVNTAAAAAGTSSGGPPPAPGAASAAHAPATTPAAGPAAPISPGSALPPSLPPGLALMAGGFITYKASKAALNMVMLIQARDLLPEDFTVVSLHPGWVATDMGQGVSDKVAAALTSQQSPGGSTGAPAPGPPAGGALSPPLTAEASVGGLLQALRSLGPADSGRFIGHDGNDVPF